MKSLICLCESSEDSEEISGLVLCCAQEFSLVLPNVFFLLPGVHSTYSQPANCRAVPLARSFSSATIVRQVFWSRVPSMPANHQYHKMVSRDALLGNDFQDWWTKWYLVDWGIAATMLVTGGILTLTVEPRHRYGAVLEVIGRGCVTRTLMLFYRYLPSEGSPDIEYPKVVSADTSQTHTSHSLHTLAVVDNLLTLLLFLG